MGDVNELGLAEVWHFLPVNDNVVVVLVQIERREMKGGRKKKRKKKKGKRGER